MNVEKRGQKRVKQSEHLPPIKRPRTAARTSLATKSCPEFNFRHKFSLLVVGPTQSKKTYFFQQILKLHNRIVYEGQQSIRIFWYYNQWQECYEKLKMSLKISENVGKSI